MSATYQNWWEGDLERWRNQPEVKSRYSEREFQQTRLYRAERTVWEEGKFRETFSSIEEVQAWVDSFTKKAWFKRRFADKMKSPNVKVSSKCVGWAYGCYADTTIRLPIDPSRAPSDQWGFRKSLILHEVAHAITPYISGGGHGRFYARAYLELVQFVLGEQEYKQLRDAFKKGGVKYRPKMQLSDAERKRRSESFRKRFSVEKTYPRVLKSWES